MSTGNLCQSASNKIAFFVDTWQSRLSRIFERGRRIRGGKICARRGGRRGIQTEKPGRRGVRQGGALLGGRPVMKRMAVISNRVRKLATKVRNGRLMVAKFSFMALAKRMDASGQAGRKWASPA